MNVNVIRKIDQYAGPIVCRLVSFFGKLGRVSAQAKVGPLDPNQVKNIMIIKYFGIGSILLSSPAIMKLKNKYPKAVVTIVTLSANEEICRMLPAVDRVLCLKIDSLLQFVSSYLSILRTARRMTVDVVIDLEFFTNFSALTTLLISTLASAPVAIGFQSPSRWRNRVYQTTVSFDHSRHISRIFMKVAHVLCSDNDDDQISFEQERSAMLKNADLKFYDELLSAKDLAAVNKKIICINIDAGVLSLHRRWPRENFLVLVRELLKRPDVIIQLIGGQESQAYVADFYQEIPPSSRVINLCGKTTIPQLIGLLSKCALLVTNDGGPLHLAHVLGVPSVSFFGPETPYLYGPLGKTHHVFYEDMFCSPCLNIYNSKLSECKENICLQRIKPDRVLQLINEKYLS